MFLICKKNLLSFLESYMPRRECRAAATAEQILTESIALWSDVQQGYAWVHRAAHILTNDEKQNAVQVRQTYERLLTEMEQAPPHPKHSPRCFPRFSK